MLAVTRDLTPLRAAHDALDAKLAQQERLAALAALAVAAEALDPLLEDAVTLLSDTLEVAGAAVVARQSPDDLHVPARRGWGAEATPAEILEVGRRALRHAEAQAARAVDEPCPAAGAPAVVATPIRTPRGAYGALVVGVIPPRELTEEEGVLLEAVSDVLGAAAGRIEAQASLREQSLRDPLTGLANRTLLLDRTQLALDRLSRVDGRIAVVFLDLDDFKLINDGLGHDVGDALLVEVAARLASLVRPGDTIARFGGDEFVVLCEGLDAHDAAAGLASRLLESMRATFALEGHLVRITVSIGLAVATDRVAAGELLRWADTAMYRAKARGRARVEVFDDTLRDDVERRLGLRSGLERALERGELHLAYQPQVAVADGQVLGAEALLRWQHPDRGELEPGAFLAVAEDSGLIAAIGRWVRREAIAQAARWQPLGAPQLSLNLSSRDLEDEGLVEDLAGLLDEHGLAPQQLCVEVTENAVLRDLASAQRALEALAKLGVVIALDDFGTGYSSLRHLHELPVAIVKIDRSFVRRLEAGGRHDPLVAGAFALLSKMGLRTLAEGVETRPQLTALAELGCGIVQGFLFSPPVSPEAMAAILADRRGLAPASPPSAASTGPPPPEAHPQASPE
ncbi:MAG: EAL domain-containing protein [Egibacteraceae bacterium]